VSDRRDRQKNRRGRATLPESIDPKALIAAAEKEQPVLVVLTGPQVGQRILLELPALIGQDPEADLMIVDDGVEWHHATVFPKDGVWRIRDLTGDRRTEVNERRVGEAVLADDDQILVGGTVLRFEVHDPIEQAFDEAIVERLTKDHLTGLLARRTFDIELASAVSAAQRQARSLALIVADIDGVKRVNDRYGHEAGAGLIADVGRRIGELVGDGAIACRLGGDEFGVLLPRGDLAAARALGEELRAAIDEAGFTHEGAALAVTVSVGVAVYPDHADEPLDLLRRADEAMYVAKRAGGNGVHPYAARVDGAGAR